jgi:hypothetical protein
VLCFFILGQLTGQAPCNNNVEEPTDICQTAPVVCELENYCNTMPVSVLPVPATICGTAISLDNPHWFSFIATANTVSITIQPTNCLAGGGGAIGLQGAIVGICPSPFGGFFETVGSCQASPCSTDEFTIGVGGIYEIGRQFVDRDISLSIRQTKQLGEEVVRELTDGRLTTRSGLSSLEQRLISLMNPVNTAPSKF